jgi:hypothetical protein
VRKGGVLYYQVNWVVLHSSEEMSRPLEEDPAFTDKADSFGLRFYFYHKFDYGMNGHLHDLEMAEFRIKIERTKGGCHRLRVSNVIAFAHGTDWYSNELLVEGDTKFPITLLVEEGKHASGPDRNADGQFTPGYDINTRVNDAWGVRDVFGSGYLLAGAFQSSMAKTREKRFRVMPSNLPELACVPSHLSSIGSGAPAGKAPEFLNRYELRPGYLIPLCTGVENYAHLAKWTEKNQFGATYQAPQKGSELSAFASQPLAANRGWFPKLSVRRDRFWGLAIAFNGLDLKELYIVPKFNLVKNNSSVELLFTRTATQYASPYLSMGYGRSSLSDSVDAEVRTGFVTEAGVKFRLRVDWPWRILGAGYEFAGVRLGLKTSGIDDLSDLRFVGEFGAGLW